MEKTKKVLIPRDFLTSVITSSKMVDRISYLLSQELSGLKNHAKNNKELLAFLNVRIDSKVGIIHKLVGNLHRTAPTTLRDPNYVQIRQVLKIVRAIKTEALSLRTEVNTPLLANGKGMYFRTIVTDLLKHLDVAEARSKIAVGYADALPKQS